MRLSYFKNSNGSAEVLEENNYYPFGLKHEGYNPTPGNPAYKYQYGGKELQTETGWNDFGARMYMADIARWGAMDPLAEVARAWTPYRYAFNNPLRFIDPDGRIERSDIDKMLQTGGSFNYSNGNLNYLGGGTFGASLVDDRYSEGFYTPSAGGDILDAILSGNYFQGINFSQFGNIDPTPKRKYLQQTTNSYFGAIESVDQYQLDHANWTDEYQGTMEFLGNLKEYFDSAGDNLGGAGYGSFAIDNLKTVKDIVEKFKAFNPSLGSVVGAIVGVVGTSIKLEGDRFGQIMDIYKNADYRYDQLHKQNPMLDKGVTVNVNVIIGTNGGGYTNISIFDISTHRYLSGGQIVHRK